MRTPMANYLQSIDGDQSIETAIRDRSPDSLMAKPLHRPVDRSTYNYSLQKTEMGRRGCCTGFLCLSFRKRGKQVVPATRIVDGSSLSGQWGANGPPQSGVSNQFASVSPSLLAPPSSPASFQNSAVQSSVQSPSAFPATLAVACSTSQGPLATASTMFQTGPYAHETALVSPPVFSTFTTAPSSAPFTPPSELATHLTTPSSPDVPFAQLLASSLGTKTAVRLQPPPAYSASPFASSDIIAADDLQATYQLYPGSPLAHLLSPTSGTGESTPVPDLEISSPFGPIPDLENSVQVVATMFSLGSPLMTPDVTSSIGLEVESPSNSCSFRELRQEERLVSTTVSSVLPRGENIPGRRLVESTEYARGESFNNVNEGRGGNLKGKPSGDGTSSYERSTYGLAEGPENTTVCDTGLPGILSDQLAYLERHEEKYNSDHAERNTSRVTVTCCAQMVMKSIHEGKSEVDCSEALVKSEKRSLKSRPRLLDQHSGCNVVEETMPLEKSPTKVIISEHAFMESGRTESCIHRCMCATCMNGATLVTQFTICRNCVRSQHAPVACAKGYFDTSIVQQSNSAGQKLKAARNSDEQSPGCYYQGGKLEKVCDKLITQRTANLTGFDLMDRPAITIEQHCKVKLHHQRSCQKS